MKSTFKAVLFVMAIFLSVSQAAMAEAPATAGELVDMTLKAYDGIQSHKYTWTFEGMDTFSKERRKEMAGHYESMAKKAGVEADEVEDTSKMVRAKYEIKFMKPYLSQMKVIKSDVTPKIIWGTIITYRSDKNEDVWWAKPKISPVAIKRSVKDDDAGGAFTSNWTVALMHLQYFMENGETSLGEEQACEDGTCYVLSISFEWEKTPKWNRKKPSFEKFQIPEAVADIIWKDLLSIESQKFSRVDYFIRKKDLTLYKEEQYIDGKFHWRNSFINVELNGLDKKDF